VRIVFFGTAEFAVPSLRATADAHNVLAVLTQPDHPGHRGAPAARPVAGAARELHLDVWQPARARDPQTIERVAHLQADALVVAAYGQILPVPLLEAARHGGVNVHASLLPRWRGAAPVAAAILAGDEETGTSIMRMEAGLDTGPVYAQRGMPITANATTPALTATLAALGAELLVDVLEQLERGAASALPQDGERATYAPRLTRADADVSWDQHSAVEVDRRVRALQPWPGVVAMLGGQRVQIIAGARIDEREAQPGEILALQGESAVVSTRDGAYRVDAIRPPGGRTMSAAAYLRGRRGVQVPR